MIIVHVNNVCLSQIYITYTAPPEATSESEIVQESSHTNSASGTTQQVQQTTEGELEYFIS